MSADRLEAINRLTTVASLLSNAVHEVANAVQVIRSNAELLERTPDQPDKVIARARTIVKHAAKVAERLQQLSALASAPPAQALVNLSEIADHAVSLRAFSLRRGKIAATVHTEGEAMVSGDRNELLRLVVNLVLNAERAVSGRPGGTIEVTVARVGDVYRLTVRDNGAGIAPEIASGVFEDPFVGESGPGLGLLVARRMAERHGGTLRLASTGAEGTTVALELRV